MLLLYRKPSNKTLKTGSLGKWQVTKIFAGNGLQLEGTQGTAFGY